MKIFVVVSGEYSSYGIEGIFDEKEKAEKFAAYLNTRRSMYSQADIEEWELNQFSDKMSRGLGCFEVYFENIALGDARVWPADATNEEGEISYKRDYGKRRDYRITLWAKDEEGALKIANERRVQYLLKKEQETASK